MLTCIGVLVLLAEFRYFLTRVVNCCKSGRSLKTEFVPTFHRKVLGRSIGAQEQRAIRGLSHRQEVGFLCLENAIPDSDGTISLCATPPLKTLQLRSACSVVQQVTSEQFYSLTLLLRRPSASGLGPRPCAPCLPGAV